MKCITVLVAISALYMLELINLKGNDIMDTLNHASFKESK